MKKLLLTIFLILFYFNSFSQDNSKWVGIYNDNNITEKPLSAGSSEIKIYIGNNNSIIGTINNKGMWQGQVWDNSTECKIDFISNIAYFYDIKKTNKEPVLKLKYENGSFYMEYVTGWFKIIKTSNTLNITKDDKKQWINEHILDLIQVNRSFEKKLIGTENLIIYLENKTGYKLDYILVEVYFYGSTFSTLYCKKEVVFDNIDARSIKNSLPGPKCENGKDIRVKIKKIVSKDLNLDRDF
ncbi:MAG: hypothetical protein WCO13_11910 [Bacteroidota bacterium]